MNDGAAAITGVNGVANFFKSPLWMAVLTGLTGYFVYPQNDRLVGLVRRNEWLRYVFLFVLIWQGRGDHNWTRSVLAVGVIYLILNFLVPAVEKTFVDVY